MDFVRFQRMCDYFLKRILVFFLIIVYVAAVICLLFDKNNAWKCQYARLQGAIRRDQGLLAGARG